MKTSPSRGEGDAGAKRQQGVTAAAEDKVVSPSHSTGPLQNHRYPR